MTTNSIDSGGTAAIKTGLTTLDPFGYKQPYKYSSHRLNLRYWVAISALVLAYYALATHSQLATNSNVITRLKTVFREHAHATGSNVSTDGLSSNGRTNDVQWDGHSLVLKGQRVFLHSGEFHTFRLPVPSLWSDVLEKMKAAGLNAVSLYTHMGMINPSPGVIDLDGFRALNQFFEACAKTGLWVVLRPGPYINAETTAGGLSHWITTEVAGELRTNASDFREAWKPYIRAIIDAATPYQITEGGPIIAVQLDNEYPERDWGHGGPEFFEDLKREYHNSGIVVPLTYNDPSPRKTFVNGTGAADLYGLDSYPQRFDCSNPETWNPVIEDYHHYHQNTNPSQPFYSPEFQAGSFDPWGPHAPGYDACRSLTNGDFQSVFYLSLWAANAKMINYYMVYGGTSWGNIPFPGVYTSYDYGAPISEGRELTPKYSELKRQGLFIRSTPAFYKTEWIGNNTDDTVKVSDNQALVVWLQSPDTDTNFYIARQKNSSSLSRISFYLNIQTSDGIKVPEHPIVLSGRQAKMIVANYEFGQSYLLYSTAQVLFAGMMGERDVVFLHGDARHTHEVVLSLTGTSITSSSSTEDVKFEAVEEHTRVTILPGVTGVVTLWDSARQLVIYADSDAAATFWAPTLDLDGDQRPFAHFWQLGTNTTVLIGGPYLVRSATLASDGTLALRGDLLHDVRLFLFAPPEVRRVKWNGMLVVPDLALDAYQWKPHGIATLHYKHSPNLSPIKLPKLQKWRYANSLPEIESTYDDSKWAIADHKDTNIPQAPHYGDGRVLYGCDYGFCEGVVLWRGYFESVGTDAWVNLSINGGEAFAASVFLNDVFLKTTYGNSSKNENIVSETDEVYTFPKAALKMGTNILTIVQDNMGLDETETHPDSSKSPRGIRGFKLSGGRNFTAWKVQGKVGGYRHFPDKIRGVLNEGGLFGERAGWHLPEFDTRSWHERQLEDGLPDAKAGVGFFVTNFELQVPEGYDAPISFIFEDGEAGLEQPYRALLFVNGWNFGKRIANLGPQYKFPVPSGIMNHNGMNTIAVIVWAMENIAVSPKLSLRVDNAYDSAIGPIRVSNPGWSPEGREM